MNEVTITSNNPFDTNPLNDTTKDGGYSTNDVMAVIGVATVVVVIGLGLKKVYEKIGERAVRKDRRKDK